MVVRPYTAQAEGEINLYKSDRVKGENLVGLLVFASVRWLIAASSSLQLQHSRCCLSISKSEKHIQYTSRFL